MIQDIKMAMNLVTLEDLTMALFNRDKNWKRSTNRNWTKRQKLISKKALNRESKNRFSIGLTKLIFPTSPNSYLLRSQARMNLMPP